MRKTVGKKGYEMDLLGSMPELLGSYFGSGATAKSAFCADQDRGADGSTSAVSRAWPSPLIGMWLFGF